MRQVFFLRPDEHLMAVAFVLGENEEHTLLYVWCRSPLRPDFIAVAQDSNHDGIYEDAEANWLSVSPEQTAQIAAILKWVGYQLK